MIKVFCRKETDTAVIPMRMHEGDAGYDVFADESKQVCSGQTVVIKTGVSIQMPKSLCAMVISRSGLAAKEGIFVLNSPGLIDSGYRGEIMVILHNSSDKDFGIVSGDRIAQLVFSSVQPVELRATLELLDTTDRGINGLGSTGVSYLGEDYDLDDVPVSPA